MIPTVPFWGVSADDRAVTAVRVQRDGDVLEMLDTWILPVTAGTDPLHALLETLSRRRLREHALHIAVPARGGTFRTFRIAPEDATLPQHELERELHDFTPFEERDVLLRARRLGPSGSLDFLVAADRRKEVVRWESALEDAGFRLFGIGMAPVAQHHGLLSIHGERSGGRQERSGERQWVLAMAGRWSYLTVIENGHTVRYPVPQGSADIEDRLRVAGHVDTNRWFDGDGKAPDPRGLLGPLGDDLARLVAFHESLNPRTGDETLLLAGPDAHRAGLRAALAAVAPFPLVPLPTALPAGLRAGGRLREEHLAPRLPALAQALGAALAAAELAPADLELRPFPENVPPPPKGDLFVPAAAVLAAATLAAGFMAPGAPPPSAPASAPSPMAATLDPVRVDHLRALVDAAGIRCSLGDAASRTLDLFPVGSEPQSLEARSLRIERDGAGYATTVRLVLPRVGEPDPGTDEDRARRRLSGPLASGWTLASANGDIVTLRRYDADTGAR